MPVVTARDPQAKAAIVATRRAAHGGTAIGFRALEGSGERANRALREHHEKI